METQETTIPRGIKNNNPGNIRKGEAWQGLSETQTDPAFCQFTTPAYGIRAIEMIMLTYHSRGLSTITQIINTWAPTNENNTQAYIDAVCQSTGFGPNDVLNVTVLDVATKLIKAIIHHENGQQPYSDEIIHEGLQLAGLQAFNPQA